jgi:hypothetical protein
MGMRSTVGVPTGPGIHPDDTTTSSVPFGFSGRLKASHRSGPKQYGVHLPSELVDNPHAFIVYLLAGRV